jgi:hypothetical protein
VQDAGVAQALLPLPKLTALWLDGVSSADKPDGGAFCASLGPVVTQLTGLRALHLGHASLHNSDIVGLSALHKLERLSLRGGQELHGDYLDGVAPGRLSHLCLSDMHRCD